MHLFPTCRRYDSSWFGREFVGNFRNLNKTEARLIYEQFANYNQNFRRITQRAKQRFETLDWAGSRDDLKERIDLYEKSVERTVNALKTSSDVASLDGLHGVDTL